MIFEVDHIHKNGSIIATEIAATLIFDKTGNPQEVIGVTRNITQRKQTEKAIIENAANFKAIIENTTDKIWAINTDYEIINTNSNFEQAFFESFGVHLLPGMNILNELPDFLQGSWKSYYGKAFNNEQFIFEDSFNVDGNMVYVEVAMNPIIVDSKVIGASVFSRDITERRRVEEKEKEATNRLASVANTLPGVIYQYEASPDGSSRFLYINDAVQDYFYLSAEELTKDASAGFANVLPEDLNGFISSIQESAINLTPWKHEYRINSKEGSIRTLFGNSIPQRMPNGATVWSGFITDITERKEIELELEKHKNHLEILVKNRTEELMAATEELILTI
jgi:PAS domain S-box-containing protein